MKEKIKLIDGTEKEVEIKPLTFLKRNELLKKAIKSKLVGNQIAGDVDLATLIEEGVKMVVSDQTIINQIDPVEGDRIFNKYVAPFLGIVGTNQEGD